jgi:hypothetical protein
MNIRKIIEEEMFRMLHEEEGDLKALVNKDPDEELDEGDAAAIGRAVAQMEGDRLKSYLSMMRALGGYYSGSSDEAEERLDRLREIMFQAYNEEKEQQNIE